MSLEFFGWSKMLFDPTPMKLELFPAKCERYCPGSRAAAAEAGAAPEGR